MPKYLEKISSLEVANFLLISEILSLESTNKSRRSHSKASANVALNASNVALGILSIKPIVSASNTLGLAAILPTVVSKVENNLSSTNTSFPDNLRKRLDLPALV